jgi:hypothetical protein
VVGQTDARSHRSRPRAGAQSRQTGYDENSQFYGFNNFAWGEVLQNLKQVVEKSVDRRLP